jgi:uncharacterized protein YjbJ (UPF0337 family)
VLGASFLRHLGNPDVLFFGRWNAWGLRLFAGCLDHKEGRMQWKHVERMWKSAKAKVQDKWDKLTNEDLDLINGRRDRLEYKIQQRYGFAPDHVRKEIDDWVRWQVPLNSHSGATRLIRP